jgi:hypothetical protein
LLVDVHDMGDDAVDDAGGAGDGVEVDIDRAAPLGLVRTERRTRVRARTSTARRAGAPW